MAKNKTIVKKNCPFCGQQVAVASKNCPNCKHSFYEAKRLSLGLVSSDPSTSNEDNNPSGSSRRTSRVKREKPNYYDASEFEKKTKKMVPLKKHCEECHLRDVKAAVQLWLGRQGEELFADGIKNLVHRWEMCMNITDMRLETEGTAAHECLPPPTDGGIVHRPSKRQGSGNPRGRPPNNPQAHGLKTIKKKKHHTTVREVEEEDEPIILNAEKLEQCSIILAELNRKFVGTTFRV